MYRGSCAVAFVADLSLPVAAVAEQLAEHEAATRRHAGPAYHSAPKCVIGTQTDQLPAAEAEERFLALASAANALGITSVVPVSSVTGPVDLPFMLLADALVT